MKLYIAGGCGEHGRNCFFADCDEVRFLVDCGVMAGEAGGGYPHLTNDQIAALDYVFLTHSHADHTGALQWLAEQGYHGPIVAARETILQCAYSFPINLYLNTVCPGGSGRIRKLDVVWGRSGHCEGSVWYKITTGGKTILFSGDYTEKTQLYRCDKLRGQFADLAVLDCAYGNDTTAYADDCAALIENTRKGLCEHRLLLFPVPKYGRGIELLKLFSHNLRGVPFFGDARFINNRSSMPEKAFWFQPKQGIEANAEGYAGQKNGILFVSDPQLRTEAARKTAKEVLSFGGRIMMTGSVEADSYGAELIAAGYADECRYPVHLNRAEFEMLKSTNHFVQAIPYHSRETDVCSPILF